MKSEVFDRQGQRLASKAQATFGWDPYEVWRTRVKVAPEEVMLLSSGGSVVGDSRKGATLVSSRIAVSSQSSERVDGSLEGSGYGACTHRERSRNRGLPMRSSAGETPGQDPLTFRADHIVFSP